MALSLIRIFFVILTFTYGSNGFSSEMLFKEEGNLQVTSGDFFIMISIDIKEFYDNIETLRDDSLQLRSQLQSLISKRKQFSQSDLYLNEESALVKLLYKFYTELEQLDIYLQSFLATLPHTDESIHPQKRSVFQPSINAIAHLFGIATTEDIENINNLLNTLGDNQNTIVTSLNSQIKILNASLSEISSLQVDFRHLKHQIGELQDSVAKLESRKETETTVTLSIIFGQLIESGLVSLTSRLQMFIFALSQAKNGHFNPALLPANSTLRILQSLPKKITKLLPRKVSRDSLPFYYDIMTPHIIRGRSNEKFTKLSLILHLPILSYSNNFKLYQLQTLPIPAPNTKFYAQLLLADHYFGVSENLDKFITLPDLKKCVQHFTNYICHLHTPIYTASSNHCLIQTYLNLDPDSSAHCQRLLIRDFTPRFIKIRNGYMYSIYSSITLTKKCNNTETQLTLKGIGTLEVGKDCIVVNPSLILPPVSIFSSATSSYNFKPNLGNVSFEHDFADIFELVNNTKFSQVLDHFGDKIKNGIPIKELQQKLKIVKINSVNKGITLESYHSYGATALFVAIIVLILVCLAYYTSWPKRCFNFLCPSTRQINPSSSGHSSGRTQETPTRVQVHINNPPGTLPAPPTPNPIQRSFRRISSFLTARPPATQSNVLYDTIEPDTPTGPISLSTRNDSVQYVAMHGRVSGLPGIADVNTM